MNEVFELFLKCVGKNLDGNLRVAVSMNGNPAMIVNVDPKTGDISARPDQTDDIADSVIDYLNSVAGTNYRHTKTNRRFINARIAEGHTTEDCLRVIDARWRAWQRTSMQEYMRPSTLFNAEKFEGYLNAVNIKPRKRDNDFLDHPARTYSDAELSGISINLNDLEV